MRRQVGRGLDALGLGPDETPYRVIAAMAGARLRAYQPAESAVGPAVLIIPAPFKRAYIWDLLPPVSVVRRCLERGVRVYLLEWLDPTEREDGYGLAEYADRMPAAALDILQLRLARPDRSWQATLWVERSQRSSRRCIRSGSAALSSWMRRSPSGSTAGRWPVPSGGVHTRV
jgi:hypothetical protein